MEKNNQNGSTMLETIGAIMIVSVLTISAIKLIGSLFDIFKQNMIVSEIHDLQKNIASRFKSAGNYEELKSMDAAQMKAELIIPSQMLVNGEIVHRLNGEVVIRPSIYMGNEYFDVVFKQISLRSCLNLSQIKWNYNKGEDLYLLRINGKEFILPLGTSINGVEKNSSKALPVSTQKAIAACKEGKENVLVWTFH